MKFTCTDNVSYKGIPKKWIDYNLNETDSIIKYYHDELYVYDTDNCFDGTVYFYFENGKAYRFDYLYWIPYERSNDTYLKHDYSLEEIDSSIIERKFREERDWLTI